VPWVKNLSQFLIATPDDAAHVMTFSVTILSLRYKPCSLIGTQPFGQLYRGVKLIAAYPFSSGQPAIARLESNTCNS
jgi:hypothetical protein